MSTGSCCTGRSLSSGVWFVAGLIEVWSRDTAVEAREHHGRRIDLLGGHLANTIGEPEVDALLEGNEDGHEEGLRQITPDRAEALTRRDEILHALLDQD